MNKEKNAKRKRSRNWTTVMKEAFIGFVREHAEIVNSKANDAKTIILKKEAWKHIGANMLKLGHKTDEKHMREMWVRIKCQTRQALDEPMSPTANANSTDDANMILGTDDAGPGPAQIKQEEVYLIQDVDPVDAMENYADFDEDAATFSTREKEFTPEPHATSQSEFKFSNMNDWSPRNASQSSDNGSVEKIHTNTGGAKKRKLTPRVLRQKRSCADELISKRTQMIEEEQAQRRQLFELQLQNLKDSALYEKQLFEKKLEILELKKQQYIDKSNLFAITKVE